MNSTLFESPRDILTLTKVKGFAVQPGPVLRATGWRGGQWVQYIDNNPPDEWIVEASEGRVASGYLADASEDYRRGSRGSELNYTSRQLLQGLVAPITMFAGHGRTLFKVFETVALTAGGVRSAGPITYTINDTLKVSENGLLCNDPDANLLAATGGSSVVTVGLCSLVPKASNNNHLGLEREY